MCLFRGVESHPRSLVKAISWRALGSIDTFVLSYIFTGSTAAAASIAGTEVFTKIVLFYFHERAWSLRSEEHTSELQSLMRISYAVFCLKKKKAQNNT